ncbi:hypothetical protein LTR05_008290 [Lithohypha guttulata]|uniref:Uncharacterized protein n=1 Tax=Lithohypha guttulata TaxID=1690604 RepID=A0AAN7STD2_9EURO|nr:hypothetical protein LTR05_008290 [Lithohypha guttulata]
MGYLGDLVQMNIGQILQDTVLPNTKFSGKTIVITGANIGLGFDAAKHIHRLGASRLVLACRSTEKGERAREDIIASSKSSSGGGVVEIWQLDQSNFQSVLAFGDQLRTLDRLDAFIANAGIDTHEWKMFEGFESMLTVNVVSTMLIAFLALPKLKETAKAQKQPSQLAFTGSVAHIFANSQYISGPGSIFESLNDKAKADMEDRYNLSKLLLLLAVRSLAELVEPTGQAPVIITFINPGWCKTELFRTNDGGFAKRTGLRLIGRTSEEGSRTLVHAITADSSCHGRYLSECRPKTESTFIKGEESRAVQRKFWSELVERLEMIKPGVTSI